MTRAQNILICFGALWLSEWLVVPLTLVFGRANDGSHYDGSVVATVSLGIMTSLGRSVAAALAAIIVAWTVTGPKAERWALIVAALYVIDAPV